jgi:hypothetical protein
MSLRRWWADRKFKEERDQFGEADKALTNAALDLFGAVLAVMDERGIDLFDTGPAVDAVLNDTKLIHAVARNDGELVDKLVDAAVGYGFAWHGLAAAAAGWGEER